MLFHEIYGAYYRTVSMILEKALSEEFSLSQITQMIQENAFADSVLPILQSIKNEEWLLLDQQLQTPIQHKPELPMTLLQKRWLKALLLDPRIALFQPDPEGLDDVAPLYLPRDIVYIDQYALGDPYTDELYIRIFHTIVDAIRKHSMLSIHHTDRNGFAGACIVFPHAIEYSRMDDKFRLVASSEGQTFTINVARMISCEIIDGFLNDSVMLPERKMMELVMTITDERNALERVLLHFSHCRKETEQVQPNQYRLHLWFDAEDSDEFTTRLLSFGPVIQVIYPIHIVNEISTRLQRQLQLSHRFLSDPS